MNKFGRRKFTDYLFSSKFIFRFGHVFMAETGTSVGEISGQSKSINSCDFRPARPFRLVTGSEDNTIAIFEGPPFKFKWVFGLSAFAFDNCINIFLSG